MNTYTIELTEIELEVLNGYLAEITYRDNDIFINAIYNKLQEHIDPYGVAGLENN
jgi:hypothetical protein